MQYVQGNRNLDYDILIGGGSLSSLATAITLGNLTLGESKLSAFRIAYLEPTDWPGGQLTSSLVPPDFGSANEEIQNLPESFVDLLLTVGSNDNNWDSNPGECWVTTKCFPAGMTVDYIMDLLSSFPSVDVYLNTVVKSVQTDGSKMLTGVSAIHRSPRGNNRFDGYSQLLSASLRDWYDPSSSETFEKEVLSFSANVFVEGTEFGDILINAAAAESRFQDMFVSGFERPHELSEQYVSDCGQSSTLPFVITYSSNHRSNIDRFPQGSDENDPFTFGDYNWSDIWSYRRIEVNEVDPESINGQHSNQNWNGGNDFGGGYLFLSIEDSLNQANSKFGWYGGINLDTLRRMEDRSYGWLHYYADHADEEIREYLSLNTSQTMTAHGLSKLPYLRDTRRSRRGIEGFRLSYVNGMSVEDIDGNTSIRYPDTVAIGNYNFLDIHSLNVAEGSCSSINAYPEYLTEPVVPLLPYYIPFRALTSMTVENLILPGKAMAQTYKANAGTRLHPTEWSTGVAAGGAAFIMASMNRESAIGSGSDSWSTTTDVYNNIEELQALLENRLGSPLTWSL